MKSQDSIETDWISRALSLSLLQRNGKRFYSIDTNRNATLKITPNPNPGKFMIQSGAGSRERGVGSVTLALMNWHQQQMNSVILSLPQDVSNFYRRGIWCH
jgi:hypothetical protein